MTGIIILAAGSSSRMGQAKQQLIYKEQTLLQKAMRSTIGIANHKTIVVLGARHESILPDVDSKIADIVINPDWEQGIASSIKSGVRALQTLYPQVQNVLLMLCDQPFVTTYLLQKLIETSGSDEKAIVACAYLDTVGAPVLFGKFWFDELLTLQGQEGAKKLLFKYREQIIKIPFTEGSIDVDTPEDYQRLLNG
ncbi:NTP transferase domain-containing protein [Mucilaginibacter terrae]|uniref:nucleotidyltransferase family protein n=1 Tax=Mucilaginibacter terrae TaxID=1955052 RepID=UPI003637EE86